MVLVICVFSAVVYQMVYTSLRDEMDRRALLRLEHLRLLLWTGGQPPPAGVLLQSVIPLPALVESAYPGGLVEVYSTNEQRLAASAAALTQQLQIQAFPRTGAPVLNDSTLEDGQPVRIAVQRLVRNGDTVGWLVLAQSRQSLAETMQRLVQLLALLLLVLMAAGLCATEWVVLLGLRPLASIAEQALDIAINRAFDRRIRVNHYADEVGKLTLVVNQLLGTVDETVRQHREFVADTSHELRNPLLSLQTHLDLLQRVENPTEQAECLHEARTQVERMTRLVADLLLLARSESRQILDLAPMDLRDVLAWVERDANRQGATNQVVVMPSPALTVVADEHRCYQLLWNLVENALRHTPPPGSVRLYGEPTDRGVLLQVADDGMGISEEDLPRLFDRFYRPKVSGSGGTGLGLAIVKHLAEAHGGWVRVSSTVGVGSTFQVWLPGDGGGGSTLESDRTLREATAPQATI